MTVFLLMAAAAIHNIGHFLRLMRIIRDLSVTLHAGGGFAMYGTHERIDINLKRTQMTAFAVASDAVCNFVGAGGRPERCQQQENAPEELESGQLSGFCLHGFLSGEWVFLRISVIYFRAC
jgi:hypothetical protein